MALFCGLPNELLARTFSFCFASDLLQVEGSCTVLREFLRGPDGDKVWEIFIHGAWSLRCRKGTPPRQQAQFLETSCMNVLKSKSAKRMLIYMRESHMLNPFQLRDGEGAEGQRSRVEFDVMQSLMRYRGDLKTRRRVATHVCSSDFLLQGVDKNRQQQLNVPGNDAQGEEDEDDDDDNEVGRRDESNDEDTDEDREQESQHRRALGEFLDEFDLSWTKDPEEALRQLLLVFPFLPIDAGEGADRVIKAVARHYLKQHPIHHAELKHRLGSRDDHSLHSDPASAVYILMYSIIMLNTDLHNHKIKVKMTCPEFVRSTQSTVLGTLFSRSQLSKMYSNIQKEPLCIRQYTPSSARLLTGTPKPKGHLTHDVTTSTLPIAPRSCRISWSHSASATATGFGLVFATMAVAWGLMSV